MAIKFRPPRAVWEQLGISRTTLHRMVERGEIPKPVRISKGRVGFPADEIDAVVAAMLAARDAASQRAA